MTCPGCKRQILRGAREGGVVVLSRYLRVLADGKMYAACRHCGTEIPMRAKLTLGLPGHVAGD